MNTINKILALSFSLILCTGVAAQSHANGSKSQNHNAQHTATVGKHHNRQEPVRQALQSAHHPRPVVAHTPAPMSAPHHPVVIQAPVPPLPSVGTVVETLPPGSISVNIGGVSVFVSGGIRYEPFRHGHRILYRILG